MNRTIAISAIPLMALSLAACGQRNGLQPPEGAALPPKPAFAATQPTADDLLTRRTEEAPDRSEELLTKSQERPDDRFDLPPPG
ncbi:hypothetical protein [Sphingomonas profundi]|uniref:hypothetical protein n=1 Tax=Alterirhizorhabdus profundi TaxID=2681549 RepID=UPI0012E84273|nr:hypothetical protein [Sphingomonas profundi]